MNTVAWATPPEELPSPVVDNHCHLDFPYRGAVERTTVQILDEAATVGVTRAVQIGCDIDSARWTAEAIQADGRLVGGGALHPNEAPIHAAGEHSTGLGYDEALAEISRLARLPRMRVIGETGLDYHHTGPEGRDAQVRSFRDHIALAKELGLVLQIHDRDAHADVLDVLEKEGAPALTVFHCFSGDEAMARVCVDRGYYLSFAKHYLLLRAGLAWWNPEPGEPIVLRRLAGLSPSL